MFIIVCLIFKMLKNLQTLFYRFVTASFQSDVHFVLCTSDCLLGKRRKRKYKKQKKLSNLQTLISESSDKFSKER